jgi:LuxR family maltose regulon positive regulatory protein
MALTPEMRGILAEISNIRTSLALNGNDLSLALDLSRQTKAYLSDDVEAGLFNNSRDILAVTHFNQAIALEANGEIMEASESFSKAIALNEKNIHLIPMAISHLGHLLELRGLLSKAEETYWSAMRLAEDYQYPLPLSALADVGLGQLFCERNDLKMAEYHLKKGIALGKQWNQWGSLLPGYMGLVRVAMANGTYNQANEYLDRVISTVNDFQLPWLMPQFKAYRAAMFARQGEINSASEWSHESGIELDQPIHFNQEPIAISLISVWMAMQNFNEALQLIQKLIRSNESRQAWGQVIQLLIFDALVNYFQGDTEIALASIERALELAEPENYQRIFLDEGEIMHAILLEVDDSSTGMYKDHIRQYTRQLLATFQNELTLLPAAQFEKNEFIDPLSVRELEVFKLLKKGHSNKEIAAKLFISLNTVKAHNKNIFSKLGVNNRVQAITRGHELGII